MSYEKDEEAKEERPDHVRKGEGMMDADEVQRLVHGVLKDCEQYIDDELSPERSKATDYYLGKPFGNEEDGRSQFVLTEVRDAIKGVMPGLMRIFFGPERVVEFRPAGPGKEQGAKQATDYIHHVFVEQCGGFLAARAAMKDALLKKIGILKWGWDDTTEEKSYRLENVSQEALEMLTAEEGVTLTAVTETTAAVPPSQTSPGRSALHTVEYSRKEKEGRPWVKAVPPEEIIFTRETRSQDDAICIAHRTRLTRGELVAMGIDEEELDEHAAGEDTALKDNLEEISRRKVAELDAGGTDPEAGEANEKILYIEAYMRVDVAGTGRTELRKFCTIGPSYHVVNGDGRGEPADEAPFAIGCPDPEPHTMLGLSFMDELGSIQLVKSSVLRSTLDSLALSIYPRTAYIEGQAAVEDILNNEIGAPMRMRVAGAVQPFAHPFTGKEAFPFFDFFDQMAENRIGRDKGSMGLDADALQSSTQDAVGAAVQSSQERQEELARIFAESLFKPMFRGLYRLMVKHQPRAKMVRLRGKWVEIDPRAWDADLDVEVKVAIGTSLTQQRLGTLMAIAAKQQEILTLLGPDNPMVKLSQYRDTLARIVELSGFADTEEFFSIVPPDWQPPQQGQPGPTPEQTIAQAELQIERMKTMKDLAIKEKELELKDRELSIRSQELMLAHQRETQKMTTDAQLRRYDIELKYKTQVSNAQLTSDANSMSTALDMELQHRQQDHTEAVAGHERALAEDAHEHDKEMNERRVAAQEQAAQTAGAAE